MRGSVVRMSVGLRCKPPAGEERPVWHWSKRARSQVGEARALTVKVSLSHGGERVFQVGMTARLDLHVRKVQGVLEVQTALFESQGHAAVA